MTGEPNTAPPPEAVDTTAAPSTSPDATSPDAIAASESSARTAPPPGKPLPPGLTVYRAVTAAVGGLAPKLLERRAQRGKEDPERLHERLGEAALPRPDGPVIWLHGASVGETAMLLDLAAAVRARAPGATALVTSGTRTSAERIAEAAPDGVIHQYAPVDRADAVAAFLDHWRPDAGVFAESELWPNLILAAQNRDIPLALVNARMTQSSLDRWARSAKSARTLLDAFDVVLAADQRTGAGLPELAGREVPVLGNLKHAAPDLPASVDALSEAQAGMAGRRVWLAASTHAGEDAIVARAHADILARDPSALLIIAPRHPERAGDVVREAQSAKLEVGRRSQGAALGAAPVYVADTLGEMGLWYRLASHAFVGGSLVKKVGGHNPLEPARLGCPMATGPYAANFEDLYVAFTAAGGAAIVHTAQELARDVLGLTGAARAARIAAAHAIANDDTDVMALVMAQLEPMLSVLAHETA